MQTAQVSARTLKHASSPAPATDAELVERAAKGDESAFERIMRKNNSSRLFLRMMRSKADSSPLAARSTSSASVAGAGDDACFKVRADTCAVCIYSLSSRQMQ